MIYCRYSCRLTLIGILCIGLFACGEDVPTEPEVEVFTDKWGDPIDIGKEYSIDDPKTGDIVHLSTGETYKVGVRPRGKEVSHDNLEIDYIEPTDDGLLIYTNIFEPVPGEDNAYIVINTIERGIIVPEGPPIVGIKRSFRHPYITKENNVLDYVDFFCEIVIDRKLDYHLPIYLEHRVQDIYALGEQVYVTRFIAIVEKGYTRAEIVGEDYLALLVGEGDKHQKSSLSILPYAEMKKINLPAATGFPNTGMVEPTEISRIPEGHKFRPYRIRSSSFLMGKPEIEGTW